MMRKSGSIGRDRREFNSGEERSGSGTRPGVRIESRQPGRMRFPIGWRMGIGFGLFGVAVSVQFILTRNTLVENARLGAQVDEVLTPSLDALHELELTIAESKTHIMQWLYFQSNSDNPQRKRLLALQDSVFPEQVAAINRFAESWTPEMRADWDDLKYHMEHMVVLYSSIEGYLPDFESYNDPAMTTSARIVALRQRNDGGLQSVYTAIDEAMASLNEANRELTRESMNRMDQLSSRLRLYAGNVAIGVLMLGIVIAYLVTRSILVPVRHLKRTLLYMGRGVQPESPVRVGPDEIGEMANAVNRLAEGLKRTRSFSLEVGKGHFEAEYIPLSEDDALGHALLKMRDDLASNEKELERKVRLRTAEVEEQKARIESLYTDLRDSIDYAERIQKAILPTTGERDRVFQENALFYRPRDVVSGDFYWFHKAGRSRMFSAIDCTGHGVPGAFMSLIGHNALERVSKVYTQPDKMLTHLNRIAWEVLSQQYGQRVKAQVGALALPEPSGEGPEYAGIQDGMDLAMVSIDMENMRLQYSGANNPLYIVRRREVHELKPDKLAIASFLPESAHYSNTEFDLEPGDFIVATTDGYVDQFGGPLGKKFMRRRFRELIKELSSMPMAEVQQTLERTFDKWKGDEEQVDDVLVIAVRV